MHINLSDAQKNDLKQALEANPDAEAISTTEYIIDFYDNDPPMTFDCIFDDKGIEIAACAELLFDEEMDGWYMGEQIDDAAALEALLNSIIA